jgi:hypothetical protein
MNIRDGLVDDNFLRRAQLGHHHDHGV